MREKKADETFLDEVRLFILPELCKVLYGRVLGDVVDQMKQLVGVVKRTQMNVDRIVDVIVVVFEIIVLTRRRMFAERWRLNQLIELPGFIALLLEERTLADQRDDAQLALLGTRVVYHAAMSFVGSLARIHVSRGRERERTAVSSSA